MPSSAHPLMPTATRATPSTIHPCLMPVRRRGAPSRFPAGFGARIGCSAHQIAPRNESGRSVGRGGGLPAGGAFLGPGLGALLLVGVAPHGDELTGARTARVGQAVLQ